MVGVIYGGSCRYSLIRPVRIVGITFGGMDALEGPRLIEQMFDAAAAGGCKQSQLTLAGTEFGPVGPRVQNAVSEPSKESRWASRRDKVTTDKRQHPVMA
jgi:hypothetical protein